MNMRIILKLGIMFAVLYGMDLATRPTGGLASFVSGNPLQAVMNYVEHYIGI